MATMDAQCWLPRALLSTQHRNAARKSCCCVVSPYTLRDMSCYEDSMPLAIHLSVSRRLFDSCNIAVSSIGHGPKNSSVKYEYAPDEIIPIAQLWFGIEKFPSHDANSAPWQLQLGVCDQSTSTFPTDAAMRGNHTENRQRLSRLPFASPGCSFAWSDIDATLSQRYPSLTVTRRERRTKDWQAASRTRCEKKSGMTGTVSDAHGVAHGVGRFCAHRSAFQRLLRVFRPYVGLQRALRPAISTTSLHPQPGPSDDRIIE